MAILKATAKQTTSLALVSEGGNPFVRSLRDGSLVTADWIQSLIMGGYGHFIDVGALTTPIVGGGAGTIVDLDQPEVNIGVPSDTVLVPLRVHVQCEVPADVDLEIHEIIVGYDRLATNTGGTFTTETPKNMRTDLTAQTKCTWNSAYTGNQTTEPTVNEIARAQIVTHVLTSGVMYTKFELLYEPVKQLFIVGPAQLLVYWGGIQAMSGFAQVFAVEFPKAWLS